MTERLKVTELGHDVSREKGGNAEDMQYIASARQGREG
jgi:hypothetical protein